MSRLRFIVGNVEDFNTLGIDISTCRQSVDGTKAMIHQENLTDEEINNCIGMFATMGKPFYPMSLDNPVMQEMLASPEWESQEE